MTAKTTMPVDAQAALWRQRLFEVVTALSGQILDLRAQAMLPAWVDVSKQIYSDLPNQGDLDVDRWKRSFFRAQAMAERFIVEHLGADELDRWAAATARVYSRIEPDEPSPRTAIDRLRRHAEIYQSDYSVDDSPTASTLRIKRCGIWEYRERAKREGTPITLKSACTYCTKLLSAFIAVRGCVAKWSLYEERGIHGCHWIATPLGDADSVAGNIGQTDFTTS